MILEKQKELLPEFCRYKFFFVKLWFYIEIKMEVQLNLYFH